MPTTTNLGLTKQDVTDFYDVGIVNSNMDLIDQAVGNKADKDDIPSKLPADGGNADTVGGKSPSAFASAIHTHTKADVGLSNVDNTADVNKNVKYAASAGDVGGLQVQTTLGASGLKPIMASTTDLTAGSSILAQGTVYLVYE